MMFRNHCNQSMLILAILRSFQLYSITVHELYEGLRSDLLAFGASLVKRYTGGLSISASSGQNDLGEKLCKLNSLRVAQVKDEKDGDEDDSCDVVFDVVCDVVCNVVCDVV